MAGKELNEAASKQKGRPKEGKLVNIYVWDT